MKQSDKLQRELGKYLEQFTKKKNMTKIAKESARIMVNRTRGVGKSAGQDISDSNFKRLASSTVANKRRRGRKEPKRSWLTDSGDMIKSIKGKGLADNRAIVYLNSATEILKALYNEKMGRTFFGISNKDERKLSIFINTLFRKIGRL